MIAKVIVHGADRAEALAALDRELDAPSSSARRPISRFLGALMRRARVRGGRVRHRLHRRAISARLGATPHPPNRRAVLAAARLLLERRDALAARRPLRPFDPVAACPIRSSSTGARRVGLDVLVDGKPERLHVDGGERPRVREPGHATGPEGGRRPRCSRPATGSSPSPAGRQAFVELIDPLERSAGAAEEGDGGVRAPMNGRIAALLVAEGDRVEAGQRLAVVEAMKMEHALIAPFAGLSATSTSNVGEQVEMGERIMRVEAGPG